MKPDQPQSNFQKTFRKIQWLALVVMVVALVISLSSFKHRAQGGVDMFPEDKYQYETVTVPTQPEAIQSTVAAHSGWELVTSTPTVPPGKTIMVFKRAKT